VSRRGLQVADLQALAARVRAAHRPAEIFAAVEALCADAIGQRLFTVMRFDAESFEVERLYTSDAAAYPVGGRKKKARDAWGEHVLVEARAFRANTPEEIRATFDDHDKILALGIGAILNIPLVHGGRCVGTMNFCHVAGWYTQEDEETGLLLGAFVVSALL
jgi:GAF domain-containing protein